MRATESPVPTHEDVRGWSVQQRADVARLLNEFLTPSPAARRSPGRRRLVLTVGATTVAAAMLDRLLHRSVVLNLDGDS